MKLTLIHLALIVIGILMLANLGYSVKEGMESREDEEEDSDKYILKSQIVPPVCPKCPDVTVCPNNSSAPTGWVPQPFANKDYNVMPGSGSGPITSAYEPRPMLTDFSQF